jgi:hypothetical protein
MRLTKLFKRSVAAGPVLWTTDVLPKDANGNYLPPRSSGSAVTNGALADFFFDAPAQDRIGFPATGVVVGYAGPSGAPDLVADLYVWDALSHSYYRMNNTAGQALKQGVLTTFPAVALADGIPQDGMTLDQARAGGATYALIVTPSGTVVGNYFFSFGLLV